MILVYDYGAGNLRSVCGALQRAGGWVRIGRGADLVRQATRLVLPGVGSFGAAMEVLSDAGVQCALQERVREGMPVLGICLGMQLMFDASDESPGVAGLGWLRGRSVRFERGRIPHMGWSRVRPGGPAPICSRPHYYYFAHSYYVQSAQETVAGVCEHEQPFAAAVRSGTILGVQFHPEKSQRAGYTLIRQFVNPTAGGR